MSALFVITLEYSQTMPGVIEGIVCDVGFDITYYIEQKRLAVIPNQNILTMQNFYMVLARRTLIAHIQ